jgi:UDP-GlcNAc:undecaprenyl-phosphate GlcNAc-1-phosphate transferase
LAGGVSLIASIAFVFILKGKSLDSMGYIMALSLAGSVLGFLFYNFYPAKIFMGDMGSTFIGFLLAVLGIVSLNVPDNPASIWAPIIILAVPIFDTGLAIMRRFVHRQPLFRADNNHLHHCIMAKGFTQKQTVLIIYSFALLAALIGVIVARGGHFYVGLVVIGLLITLGILMSCSILTKIKRFILNKAEIAITKDREMHFRG